MIFFLSILGILQCFVLPGIIFLKKNNETLLYNLIYVLLTSILINFFIITSLVFLNIYSKEVIYILFALQLILFFILNKFKNIKININFDFALLIKLFVFLIIVFSLYKNTGNVIYAWDALISYNEWAVTFSQGDVPQGMVRPYLIPKLWSIIYLFGNNNSVTLFTKFTTFIFPALILLICLDEILVYKKIRDLIKLFLFCLFFYLKKNFVLTGYVDIPLVAVITSFFYFYRRKKINLSIISIIIGFTIKLSSLFLMFYFLINKNHYLIKKTFLLIFAAAYIVFLYKLNLNNFFSLNIFNEMGQMENFNFYKKIKYSLNILHDKNLIYFFYLSIFGLFINNFTRKLIFFYIIPGWLYWSLMLSYDDRNFLFLMPGIIIVNSLILEALILKIMPNNFNYISFLNKKIFQSLKINLNVKLLYILFIILISSTTIISNNSIIEFNKIKQNQMIGNSIMNKKIISLIEENKLSSKNFITDYQPIFFVPKFKKYLSWENFLHQDRKNLENFDYYLIYGHSNLIREIIKKKIKLNKSMLIENINGFILVGPA